MLNKLLKRQVQKYIKNCVQLPPEFAALLHVISESYDHYEKERTLLERSIDLSSRELISLNHQLKVDIIEREKAEKKAKAAIKELNILFENIDDNLFSVDILEGKLIQISPACFKIYGYEPQEFYSDPMLWEKLIHPEDKKIAALQIEDLNNGKRVLNRYRIIHRDGSIRWVENKIIPTIDYDGRLIRIDGVTSDITEKIRWEEKLKKNEALLIANEHKYRSLFQDNPMPMWVLERNTFRILDVNNSAMRHYGYTRSEFLSLTALDLRPSEEYERFLMHHSSRKMDLQNRKGIWKHVKKDGTIIDVEINVDYIEFEGKEACLVLANDVTEKVKAEEKLKASNERYELVTKATNDAIWDWNILTNELYWTDGYEKMFGYKRSDNEDNVNSWINRIHPEDVDRITKSLTAKINDPEAGFWESEYRYMKADGSIAFIHDRGYIVYDENKIPVRMVGAMSDITNRKKAEEIYLKSEANLRNILENTDTAYVLLDTHANVLSFNNQAAELASRDLEKSISEGINYLDLMSPHRRQEVKQSIETVINENKLLSYEVKYDSRDGEGRWLYVRMNPIRNIHGTVIGLSIAATNITERKNSEHKLQKSEANLRTVFDNTDVSYVLLDKRFNVVSFNSRALEGYRVEFNKDLVEGVNFMDFLPKERSIITRSRYEMVLKGNKISYETEFPHPDGNSNWYYISVFPVHDEFRNILGLIVAAEDITNRKNQELEKEKITADLMQRNKTLEQFAYIISHNLRSPVANITGLSNIILNSPTLDPKDYKKCMEGLALSVKKLDDVIIDLNYILQVRREVNEKKETVRFSGLVRDIKTSINNLIEKEDITIRTNFINANELFAIKSYLNSIFYNLISNSIKYRKPGEKPKIEIRSKKINNKIQLIFKDNGLGIDLAANGNKIFGLYKKFHTHVEGKGMGLYMVKTQVEILGGRIDVRSEVNKGTEFVLEFDTSRDT